jgi:hypothetical protein
VLTIGLKLLNDLTRLLFSALQGMFHVEHQNQPESAFPESLLSLHPCL